MVRSEQPRNCHRRVTPRRRPRAHVLPQQRYSIGRADLDGANANNNFITGMTNKVRGIAVNDSHVYWTQYVDLSTETDRAVFRLGLAGSRGRRPHLRPLPAPSRIAVDGTYIYWVNEPLSNTNIDGRESVSRARLDGSDKIDIYVDPWGGAGQGGQTMYSIAVAGNRLFIGYFGETSRCPRWAVRRHLPRRTSPR